jgi:two-component system cell cycle response regulator
MNILLVEDDPTDMKLLSAVLKSSGHRVLEKGSAEQALEQIRTSQPEMVLLDLKLPGMDGLALARLLKSDQGTRHIPIVAITAAPEKFSREAALAAGCDAFVTKPIDTRKLPDEVAALRFQADNAKPRETL